MTLLERIKVFLEKEAGFKVDSLSPKVLDALIEERREEVNCGTLEDYFALLQNSSEEVHLLLERLIPPESWFFRHPHAFEEAANFALKRKRSGKTAPTRVLSIGCSRGEEPFSAVIAFLEAGLGPRDFHVEGCDFNSNAIEQAKRGFYTDNAFRGDDLHFRDRYFEKKGGGYVLDGKVRSLVTFRQGDALAEECWKGASRYDVIFCRHLIIYLSEGARQVLYRHLREALKPNGCLFVGPTEVAQFLGKGYQSFGRPKAYGFQLLPERAEVSDDVS